MSLASYHVLHVVGIMCLFLGFGSLFSNGYSKSAMKWHGIGLVLLVVSGFGNLAKLGLSAHMPGWVIAKIVLLVVLAIIPSLMKRGKLVGNAAIAVTLVVATAIVYLAAFKPF
jgi:hypothetical protein